MDIKIEYAKLIIYQVLGGSTVIHGMTYMRGSRKDYDDWEKLGNEGWSYKDVLPFFINGEDNLQIDKMDKGYHGVGGIVPVTQFPYYPPVAYAILEGAKELGKYFYIILIKQLLKKKLIYN